MLMTFVFVYQTSTLGLILLLEKFQEHLSIGCVQLPNNLEGTGLQLIQYKILIIFQIRSTTFSMEKHLTSFVAFS